MKPESKHNKMYGRTIYPGGRIIEIMTPHQEWTDWAALILRDKESKQMTERKRNAYIVETGYDIQNPTPDRRSRDWNKLPKIPTGSRFIVRETPDKYWAIRPSDSGYSAWETTHSQIGKLILANSGTVEPKSVKELMVVHDCDWSEGEVLRILIKLGKVTPADFDAVAGVPEGF